MAKKRVVKIAMPYLGDCLKIAKAFGCAPQTVSNALNMRTMHSEQADKIRQYALSHGGVEIKM